MRPSMVGFFLGLATIPSLALAHGTVEQGFAFSLAFVEHAIAFFLATLAAAILVYHIARCKNTVHPRKVYAVLGLLGFVLVTGIDLSSEISSILELDNGIAHAKTIILIGCSVLFGLAAWSEE